MSQRDVTVAWLQLGGAKSWHERIAAPDVVVSHRSAAHLRGLGDLIPHEHEFYATTRLRPRRKDIKLRVRSEIAPGSWEVWGGLPVRTVPAIIDDLLSDHEDESAVAQVVRDALALGLLRRGALKGIIEPHAVAYGRRDPAELLRVAMRRLELPERFAVPDPVGWAARYPRVAAESPGPVPDYDTAVNVASQVFDPILDATATGAWDPSAQAWIP